ncbi:hypothetical protein ACJJIK_17085 [Microbulbifer sp. ZKSA006]|uniref:hypothetical protein n=1 Tax=Microbulbifer sp. ZKSA006 TaxID=3243390 RepID=UPI00403A0C68
MISVTDVKTNTAHTIDAQQSTDEKGLSRARQYVKHTPQSSTELFKLGIKYFVAGAFYSKKIFIAPTLQKGMHIIEKL